jgi:hypothetical protein
MSVKKAYLLPDIDGFCIAPQNKKPPNRPSPVWKELLKAHRNMPARPVFFF